MPMSGKEGPESAEGGSKLNSHNASELLSVILLLGGSHAAL